MRSEPGPRYPGLVALLICILASLALCAPVARPSGGVRAVVLGIAQDGGLPHIGCRREPCVSARRDPGRRQRVACLGLVDERAGARFLVDATPDLASQLDSLNDGRVADGILLTHAHVGHYAGLMYLGREALGAKGVPVYATRAMACFLRENGPWSQLVRLGNIELREIEPGRELSLTPDLTVTPLRVPHRDELSDTVGFRIRGPRRTLLYVPDVDKWEKWNRNLADEVASVDVALLDGTFHDAAELPGRDITEVPHPFMPETLGLLPPRLRERVFFIHLNHTNRLLWTKEKGTRVARDGEELPL